jgi:hypothetical protein
MVIFKLKLKRMNTNLSGNWLFKFKGKETSVTTNIIHFNAESLEEGLKCFEISDVCKFSVKFINTK